MFNQTASSESRLGAEHTHNKPISNFEWGESRGACSLKYPAKAPAIRTWREDRRARCRRAGFCYNCWRRSGVLFSDWLSVLLFSNAFMIRRAAQYKQNTTLLLYSYCNFTIQSWAKVLAPLHLCQKTFLAENCCNCKISILAASVCC